MTKRYWTDFIISKFDALDGEVTIAYIEVSTSDTPFAVKVTKGGLTITGAMDQKIVTEKDLQELARLISDAWQDHRRIAPKIHTSLSGH